jgi:uncharacterized protein (TIGR02246 family)
VTNPCYIALLGSGSETVVPTGRGQIINKEAMMLRVLTIVPIVAIGLAVPAAAQQVSDQAAQASGESVVQAFNKAALAKDAAGLAALYTEDATYVAPEGTLFGRTAIQKMYEQDLKSVTAEPAKLDRVIMLGDKVRLRFGTWSGMLNASDGPPIHVKGYWTTTDVRDGDAWKIRLESYNVTMPPPEAGK